MTKIIINGKEVEADPKQPLIRACHEYAQDVPMYCYHPGLSPVGSCRICQVEVKVGEMPARVVPACRTPISEGMIVNTDAAKAHDARRQCLEFLLKNHPLDCPICDKAGECDLQDYSFAEGQGEGRSVEPRRKLEKRKSLGDVILLDQERCILCSRCVRFFEEVPKKAQLTVAGLGSHSSIATFADRPLEGNYQGNVADICPVGALTLKKFRFQARVWNLTKHLSTCGECSRGCSISVEVLRSKDVKRLRPRYNPEVNNWWMCDTGRFSQDKLNEEHRLGAGIVRDQHGWQHLQKTEAIDCARDIFRAHPHPLVLVSPWLTVEEGAAALTLADSLGAHGGGTVYFLSPEANGLKDDLLHTGDPAPNRRGLEEAGLKPLTAAEAREKLAETESSLLIGERIGILLEAPLAETAAAHRAVILDTVPCEASVARLQLGVPSCAERLGTWINIDGRSGRIAAAKPAPTGVSALTTTLEKLNAAVQPEEVEA